MNNYPALNSCVISAINTSQFQFSQLHPASSEAPVAELFVGTWHSLARKDACEFTWTRMSKALSRTIAGASDCRETFRSEAHARSHACDKHALTHQTLGVPKLHQATMQNHGKLQSPGRCSVNRRTLIAQTSTNTCSSNAQASLECATSLNFH